MLMSWPPSDGPVNTRVFRPERANVKPAVRPATPPPAITTSYSASAIFSFDSLRSLRTSPSTRFARSGQALRLRVRQLLCCLEILLQGPAAEQVVQRGPRVDHTDDDKR